MTDARLFDLERKLQDYDRVIAAAERAEKPIDIDTTVHRRNEIAAKIFATPAVGLAGLAVQARTFLTERKNESAGADECELEFSRLGAVLADGIARLAIEKKQT